MHARFRLRNLKEQNHSQELGTDGRNLKYMTTAVV